MTNGSRQSANAAAYGYACALMNEHILAVAYAADTTVGAMIGVYPLVLTGGSGYDCDSG